MTNGEVSGADSVLIVQLSSIARMTTGRYFSTTNLMENREYTLITNPDFKKIIGHVRKDRALQLVLVSNRPGELNARLLSSHIKEINPEAVVFALTSAQCDDEGSCLDGVINKATMPETFVGKLVTAFLREKPMNRERLITMVTGRKKLEK